jgi:hypothetical protein
VKPVGVLPHQGAVLFRRLRLQKWRLPDFMIDVDVHALHVLEAKGLPVETAWGKVPTPVF